jgi:sugar phosphate isomerase/epimerase
LIGLSPAYFISRYTDEFTPSDVAEGLAEISELGYAGFQLEVYHRRNLKLWLEGGSQQVRRRADDLDLKPTQFVAHFMLAAFANPENLMSDLGLAEMPAVLDIVSRFEACRLITVPLGVFETHGNTPLNDYISYYSRCVEKIGRLLEMVEAAGYRLALEIMPSAFIGGIDGFMRLCDHLATDSLGLNFDTGHAWSAKENLYLIPAKLGRQILGTHLCDNFRHENLSLPPGAGSIDWPRIMAGLNAAGYRGSFDIEIVCQPEAVRQQYSEGLVFIEKILKQRME